MGTSIPRRGEGHSMADLRLPSDVSLLLGSVREVLLLGLDGITIVHRHEGSTEATTANSSEKCSAEGPSDYPPLSDKCTWGRFVPVCRGLSYYDTVSVGLHRFIPLCLV